MSNLQNTPNESITPLNVSVSSQDMDTSIGNLHTDDKSQEETHDTKGSQIDLKKQKNKEKRKAKNQSIILRNEVCCLLFLIFFVS